MASREGKVAVVTGAGRGLGRAEANQPDPLPFETEGQRAAVPGGEPS